MPDKFQQLLDITDDPQNYSEEHITEVMQDPETADDYAMMVLAAQAFEAQKSQMEDNTPIYEMHTIIQKAKRRKSRRMAAIFLTLFLVSGLAVAALLPVWKTRTKTPQKTNAITKTETVIEPKQDDTPEQQTSNSPTTSIVVFQDEPLEAIMQTVCAYYHLKSVFKNEEVRQLRLHLKWNRQDGIDIFLKRLSQFEKVHVTREHDTIIIE